MSSKKCVSASGREPGDAKTRDCCTVRKFSKPACDGDHRNLTIVLYTYNHPFKPEAAVSVLRGRMKKPFVALLVLRLVSVEGGIL